MRLGKIGKMPRLVVVTAAEVVGVTTDVDVEEAVGVEAGGEETLGAAAAPAVEAEDTGDVLLLLEAALLADAPLTEGATCWAVAGWCGWVVNDCA